jgi:hypothetical protein
MVINALIKEAEEQRMQLPHLHYMEAATDGDLWLEQLACGRNKE